MQTIASLVTGLLFGLGLIVSGMDNPKKVINFLDLAGQWDPSLALVMGGAILVGSVLFRSAIKRSQSVLGAQMHIPAVTKIDARLMLGSLIFGVGWGAAGYCPGPALVSLLQGNVKSVLFVIAMLSGMAMYELIEALRSQRSNSRGSRSQ